MESHFRSVQYILSVIHVKPDLNYICFGFLWYLEDISEGLSGQLVVDDGEEFADRPQEAGGLHTLSQQVLYGGKDVDFCLLKQKQSDVKVPLNLADRPI